METAVEDTQAPPGGRNGDRALSEDPTPNLGQVQDRETFADFLFKRVSSLTEEEPEKDVIWRWTHIDRNHLALFVALAQRYGLKVFRVKGTRGHTVYVEGPRNIIWDLKRYAWDPLCEVIRMAIEDYFEGVVGAEAGVQLDLDAFDTLVEVEKKVKPSRVETEH